MPKENRHEQKTRTNVAGFLLKCVDIKTTSSIMILNGGVRNNQIQMERVTAPGTIFVTNNRRAF